MLSPRPAGHTHRKPNVNDSAGPLITHSRRRSPGGRGEVCQHGRLIRFRGRERQMLTASQSQKTRTLSEQEIEQLFVDHYDLLYAAAKSVTDNKHDAEDIVQTLFLKFVGQKFWPEITTNFKGYLYRVAVNEARGMIRSRNRLKEIDTGAVFVSLDRLERGGLISARPSERPEDESNLVFSVTPEGERMLREVRSAAKQLMEALNDRAPGWPPAQCDIRRGLRHRGKSRESCKSLLLFLSTEIVWFQS